MLRIKNLSKSFDNTNRIFAPLSFELNQGDLLQITGENGSGKTTLLKCLAGYLSFDSEVAEYCNRPISFDVVSFASTDDRSFFPRLTLKENINFFKRFYATKAEEDENLWKIFGLENYSNMSYQDCSTGIRKRLAILRAFIKNSPILLLDEPFANLDPKFSHRFARDLTQLIQEKQKILIFSTNDGIVLDQSMKELVIK